MVVSVPVNLMWDKGDGRKVWEGENFVKLAAKYIQEEKEIDVNCTGISSKGNDSVSTANNISYTLQSYDTPTNYVALDNVRMQVVEEHGRILMTHLLEKQIE